MSGSDTDGTAGAAQQLAEKAAAALLARDRASQALGMRLAGVRPGWAKVVMRVRADMVNGHGLCHGGVVFALGDSAFAFACNSHNESTVAAAAAIDFLAGAREGDELTAEASELWRSRRNGIYEINVSNQRGERIALLRGRSWRIDGQVVGKE
ncbi:MAG: hydroxyphenylacetyl-CoA thioesterase PaaI [Gammaproteobacteria bacterium]|nr:hydroxyphenylacetyl-CoA thioesterase PaaI [Gammaproteobacteria bacterium]MBV8403010.1 hydroxyphenylacetyl-CoA thioesterase PaaI [Gammaproteobacteria bacterium]